MINPESMSRLTVLSTSCPCQQTQNDTFWICWGWFPHCRLATFPSHSIWGSGFKTQLLFSHGSSVQNSLISTRLEQMKSISPILVTDEALTANQHKVCNDALFHEDMAHLMQELKINLIYLCTFLHLRSTGSTVKHKHHCCAAREGSWVWAALL